MAETDPYRVQAPGLTVAEMTPDEAAAKGLGYVDKNHALYGTPGYVGYTAPSSTPAEAKPEGMSDQDWTNFQARYRPQAPAPTAPGAAPAPGTAGAPPPTGATTIPGQAGAASTYSATPGAPPTQNTTNQGTQDVVRNSYLERATQPAKVDPNAPNIRQPADAFAAAAERARRDQIADTAEGFAGTGQVGAQTAENRLINERSAQSRAGFEASLVTQELQTKRAEISEALKMLSGQISDDQARALTKMLADVDAQLKTQSLNQSTGLAQQELGLKDKFGTMSGNLDLMQLLFQNGQFNKTLGFNIGDREAYWNQVNLENMLG